ncbi:MAG: alpha-galactosidase [Clostridia bacterium]|nr:alpha-galactosidase [Clostridia bacterium]
MKRVIVSLVISLVLAATFTLSACSEAIVEQNAANVYTGGRTAEMTKTQEEYVEYCENLENLPISFVYGDSYFKGFDKNYFVETSRTVKAERNGVVTTAKLKLRGDVLTVTVETAFYKDYNAYDYTVYFANESGENSKILKHVNAADMDIEGSNPVLKGINGDNPGNYAPYEKDLKNAAVNFYSYRGRATHHLFPYFNVETDEGGAMLAIGWGGTWQADFSYDQTKNATHFTGTGTVGLSTYLKPGETVRTPLIGIVRYYERDEDSATNAWRRWVVDCNLPRNTADGDECIQPFSQVNFMLDTGRPNSDGSISEGYDSWQRSLDAFLDNGLYADVRWFDAGWYMAPNGGSPTSDWWGTVGTWIIDPKKWPNDTFRESVEYFHDKGMDTMVWFEPERVTDLASMTRYGYKREWVLSDHGNNNYYVNNLGNEEAFSWTLSRILDFFERHDIDMYREDFNMDPYLFWNIGDGYEGKNRTGITENLYMQGHYRLWDGIIEYCKAHGKRPYVDSCASGGGRNDLETLRRSMNCLRSDTDRTTIPRRLAFTSSVSKWLPFTGASTNETDGAQIATGNTDIYTLRATFLASQYYNAQWYMAPSTVNWAALRQGIAEWREFNKYILKDFYNLTPYRGVDNDKEWTSFMYVDTDTNSAALQAFRQKNCQEDTVKVLLKGLDPDTVYTVRDIDGVNSIQRVRGRALMTNGLSLYAANARTAIVIYIEPVK